MSLRSDHQRYIVGRRALQEAIDAGTLLEKVFFMYGLDEPGIHRLRSQIEKSGVAVSTMDRRKFGHLEQDLGLDRNDAQGVIAMRPVRDPVSLDDILNFEDLEKGGPLIVALDGITDPHNLGAIARSAEAAGARGMIVTDQHTAPVTPVAVKASAGALEHLSMTKVQRMSTTLATARERGWTVIGTSVPAQARYNEVELKGPTLIVIGSEGSGLHPRVLDECDHIVEIPMYGKVASLNASVAAGILLFEVVRQTRQGGQG